MLTRLVREYKRYTPAWVILVLLASGLFSVTASADAFVFDATVNPMSGLYAPDRGGHYIFPNAAESFSTYDPAVFGATGVEIGDFFFTQSYVAIDPFSDAPCVTTRAGFCYNRPQFFSADDDVLMKGNGYFSSGGIGIYGSIGELLAIMDFSCAPDAVCDMFFVSGIGGRPIDPADSATLPSFLKVGLANDHGIVAVGGIQDAIDARFYDGSVDSFEFLLTQTPEPSYFLMMLASLLIGLGVVSRSRLHSSSKARRSR